MTAILVLATTALAAELVAGYRLGHQVERRVWCRDYDVVRRHRPDSEVLRNARDHEDREDLR